MVIEFKNCCLKICENCSLKSVVEIHVFSVYKTKKCVWYHILNNMFQCSKNWHLWPKLTFFYSKNIFLMLLGLYGWDWGDNKAFDVWSGGPYHVQDNYTIATKTLVFAV